jgi:threonine aldolase
MRQAIIAAGALYALEHNVNRLKEDHLKAKLFAKEISKLNFVEMDINDVQTNIIIFKTKIDADKLKDSLEKKGVLVTNEGPDKIRVVFHMDVSEEQLNDAVKIFRSLAQ